jgi:hypothetical protein
MIYYGPMIGGNARGGSGPAVPQGGASYRALARLGGR